jgi:D-alanyl-D-alanine carboxypeptidase/D-alanyl-D-alanine-endopeptidase (penicillin-binding protein 4)
MLILLYRDLLKRVIILRKTTLNILIVFTITISSWSSRTQSEIQYTDKTVIGLQFKPLVQYLDNIVNSDYLEEALIGASVVNVKTGHVVFSHNGDQLINPASVTKMFTTASALSLLHPDFRFKTEVYTRKQPKDGVADALYIKGHGDPFLVNERLSYLASEIRSLGIKRINGPLVLDDSYFDHTSEGPGWDQDNSSRPYQAPMGALSLNFNSIAALIFPGATPGKPARVELFPDSEYFQLENSVRTSRRSSRILLESEEYGNKTRVKIRGRISIHNPGSRRHCRVFHPVWYTGHSIRKAFMHAGIRMRRTVRQGIVPNNAELLYTLRSPSLGELVRKVNKRSQNFMAEQLFKTIGAELISPPGSWWKGQRVINAFLEEEVGLLPGSYILHNGSGLNDVNRVTANQVTKLLLYMWKRFDVRPDFLASLAVAGADGTVLGRFTNPAVKRTMRLKTGSLENVRALAGYINTQGDQVFAFSFLVSNYTSEGYQVSHLIDRFASAVSRADGSLQVVEEIEVLPLDNEEKSVLIAPVGPPEGTEEAEIIKGERLESKGGH